MRSSVGLLDRNIKITSDDDSEGWSYSVLIYGWRYYETIYPGSAILYGVQFKNGGQYVSKRAALNVLNTVIGATHTFVKNSFF